VSEDVLNEFDYAPGNRWEATYVTRVAQEGQSSVEGLLLTSREPLVIDCTWVKYPSGTASGSATIDKWRLTKDYVRHGIMHILNGWDHLLFISALVLAVVTLWDLVKVITAFTLAHSVTLSAGALGIVTIPDRIIEPLIAATIVWVALENLFATEPDRRRWIWSFGFGLVHGLGFASVLNELGLKGAALVRGLVGFNLGVEIGQLLFVAVFLPPLMWLARGEGARLTPRIASLMVATIGIYWLVERLFVG